MTTQQIIDNAIAKEEQSQAQRRLLQHQVMNLQACLDLAIELGDKASVTVLSALIVTKALKAEDAMEELILGFTMSYIEPLHERVGVDALDIHNFSRN